MIKNAKVPEILDHIRADALSIQVPRSEPYKDSKYEHSYCSSHATADRVTVPQPRLRMDFTASEIVSPLSNIHHSQTMQGYLTSHLDYSS